MALWRVLDLYKRAASRRGQAPAKQLTYLGIFTPKKSFAKNNTNSDLYSEFVLFAYGGAKGSRTPDLLNAIQTRYQLRYNPELLLYNNISIRLLSSVFARRIFIFA